MSCRVKSEQKGERSGEQALADHCVIALTPCSLALFTNSRSAARHRSGQ